MIIRQTIAHKSVQPIDSVNNIAHLHTLNPDVNSLAFLDDTPTPSYEDAQAIFVEMFNAENLAIFERCSQHIKYTAYLNMLFLLGIGCTPERLLAASRPFYSVSMQLAIFDDVAYLIETEKYDPSLMLTIAEKYPGAAVRDKQTLYSLRNHHQQLKDYGYSPYQIICMAKRKGGGKNLTAVAAHHASLCDIGFDKAKIFTIVVRSGGANNIKAIIKHYDDLKHLGYDVNQICHIIKHCGGSAGLQTVVFNTRALQMLGYSPDDIITMASHPGGGATIKAVLKYTKPILHLGYSLHEITIMAGYNCSASNIEALGVRAPELEANGILSSQIGLISSLKDRIAFLKIYSLRAVKSAIPRKSKKRTCDEEHNQMNKHQSNPFVSANSSVAQFNYLNLDAISIVSFQSYDLDSDEKEMMNDLANPSYDDIFPSNKHEDSNLCLVMDKDIIPQKSYLNDVLNPHIDRRVKHPLFWDPNLAQRSNNTHASIEEDNPQYIQGIPSYTI